MKIKYKNNFSDVILFSLYTYIRIPLSIIMIVLYVALSSYVNWMDALKASTPFTTFLFFEGRSILVMAGILIIVFFLSLLSKKNKNFYIDQELMISEDGISHLSEISKSELKWNGIQKITKTKKHIYLYVNQISAYIIPKRAFDSQNGWDSFYTYLLKYNKTT